MVKRCEQKLITELLAPLAGETILDAGCGTGVFTLDILTSRARVVGMDLSLPMLGKAVRKCGSSLFSPIAADILRLPFQNEKFDKVVSITALEFIEDARRAVKELFRVTKSGGIVVVATLNSLSPWAQERREKARNQETIFSGATFKSPDEMLALAPFPGIVRTAVHFKNDSALEAAITAEKEGRNKNLETGAFVAVRWQKP